MLRYPLDSTELSRFRKLLSSTPPQNGKPYAFVFGHGLWNDLDLQATLLWLQGISDNALQAAPYLVLPIPGQSLPSTSKLFHRLLITPNAAGPAKPDEWIVSQGDKALQGFEESVREEVNERYGGAVEVLGTWNMSIQAKKFDGVHLDLKGNLIKAMSVVNWLAML